MQSNITFLFGGFVLIAEVFISVFYLFTFLAVFCFPITHDQIQCPAQVRQTLYHQVTSLWPTLLLSVPLAPSRPTGIHLTTYTQLCSAPLRPMTGLYTL